MIAGNLLQRTRCYYFYDINKACNKRVPGSACDAIGGSNRRIPIAELHRLPGDTPHIETLLGPGELITAVRLPAPVPDGIFTARCGTGRPTPSPSSPLRR